MTAGLRLDLHVHSDRSPDGTASVARLVGRCRELGLDGFALTDHHTVAGHAALAELARELPALRLVPGVEVSTADGHLLAYGLEEPPPEGRPVVETAEWVTGHGGVPVLAHPFRWAHGVGGVLGRIVRVPALEVLNAHNGRRANAAAQVLAAARSLGRTGGSDAHHPADLGRAWTVFPAGSSSVDDLLEALRRGSTTADGTSIGPLRRAGLALRSCGLRLSRGLRPI
jgi:predicted metal-dependent phosphoesterase TrpH